VLQELNGVLEQPLTHEDVEGVYAGLRPLLSGESESTSKLSREHTVAVPVPGMVAVAGGKYTTYRVMARDAVDTAARGLERFVGPCCTEFTELVGAEGYRALWNQRHGLAEASGVHPVRIEHLLHRYGARVRELLALIAERRALAGPIPGAEDYLKVEAVYAASHEGALHLDDVLARRTRISIETWDRGVSAAAPVAQLVGEVLGWSDDETEREVETYIARVEAERRSQQEPEDHSADAVRTSAPDLLAHSPTI
jgi:glycerol-3-phosphate dehydrogenase